MVFAKSRIGHRALAGLVFSNHRQRGRMVGRTPIGNAFSSLAAGTLFGKTQNGGIKMSAVAGTASRAGGMSRDEKFVIFASSLGTIFEWYDFYLYAV